MDNEFMRAAEVIGMAAGMLTSAGVAWRYIVSPVFKFFKKIKVVIETGHEHSAVLAKIANEFKPNGGNSLRDVINRIEHNMVSASGKVAALIEYHNVAAFEANNKGHCTWVSRRWCEMTGMLPSEAMGNGWIHGVHEEDREKVSAEWEHAVKQQRETSSTFRIGNHHTGYVKVKALSMLLRNSIGEMVGFVGTVEIDDGEEPVKSKRVIL